MPDQFSREAFDTVARELMTTAPKGLTPEQFKTYIISNVRAKQYEGQENAGDSYLGNMAGAAFDQVKTVAKSLPAMLMDPLGTTTAKITGHGATDPLAAAGNVVKGAAMAPVNIARAINTDDPREAGREAVNAAMFLPGYRGLAAGARAVPGVVSRTARTVGPAVPRAVDATLGAVSTEPWRGVVRGVQGEGPVAQAMQQRAASMPAAQMGLTAPDAEALRAATAVEAPVRPMPQGGRSSAAPMRGNAASPGIIAEMKPVAAHELPPEVVRAAPAAHGVNATPASTMRVAPQKAVGAGDLTSLESQMQTGLNRIPGKAKSGEDFLNDMLNQDIERRHALIDQERAAGTWDRDPTPASTPPPSTLPKASTSKGATRMSENDMTVFTEAVTSGKTAPEAIEHMLKQRAARHAEKYGAAKTAAATRKTNGAIAKLAQQLNDVMKQGSH
jgi:hypothetical protein